MIRTAQASFSRNRLLSTMTGDDFDRLRPSLERIRLNAKDVLEEPGEPIEHIYFLEPCVASIVAITSSGEKIEVGLFGPEGMSGLAVVLGADRSPLQTFIQVPGNGLRLPVADLRSALADSASLRHILSRFAQAHAVQVAFTALVNGRYTIDERLSRWLLMCHDRIDGDELLLTHEFLALMLGVRRAGVTNALQILEGARIIKATRGRIDILDRAQLEEAAGDSYGPPEAEYERLMKVSIDVPPAAAASAAPN